MSDEDPKKVVRSLSPAGGTAIPMPMTRDQMAKLQAAFVQIAEGTQDLIVAVRESLEQSKTDNAITRADNSYTRKVVVSVHVVGALIAILVLFGIVRRTEEIIRAAAKIETALSRPAGQ